MTIDIWADIAATVTALAASVAAFAASYAGYFAKKAYETTQSQLRTDLQALAVARSQLQASRQPFIVPKLNPAFSDNRPDLLHAENQGIRIENIGYGPAFNIRITLCGKKPNHIMENYYGMLDGQFTFPLRVGDVTSLTLQSARRKPQLLEQPERYEEEGPVTNSIACLSIQYTDMSHEVYQTIYEWKENANWELTAAIVGRAE